MLRNASKPILKRSQTLSLRPCISQSPVAAYGLASSCHTLPATRLPLLSSLRYSLQSRHLTTTTTTSPATAIPGATATIQPRSVLPNRTIRAILATSAPGTPNVKIQGWVRSTRQQKSITFIEVNDGSSLKGIQAVLSSGEGKGLVAGTSVELEGTLVQSPGKEQALELQVSRLKIVGSCDGETYPLQKKRHTFEFLREISHLRSRAKTASAILRLRSAAAWGFQKFFESQEFVQVHTPVLTSHDCEGGGEVFKIAPRISARAQQLYDTATAQAQSSSSTETTTALQTNQAGPAPSEFFGSPTYLTVSGQLHLEIIASALTRVFTMGPVFRAEPSMTPRHLSEFWMLEAEIAFLDNLEDLLKFSEACIQQTTQHLLETCPEDIEFLSKWIDKSLKSRLEQLAGLNPGQESFQRLTYTEAVQILQDAAKSGKVTWEYEPEWGAGLQSEHEKWLAGEYFKGPVFVTDYPAALKPFYMRKNDALSSKQIEGKEKASSSLKDMTAEKDRTTVACVDLLVPGIGELLGGSMREERLDVLQSQLKDFGLSEEEYQWYLDLRRFGSVPHGGWGIGFERYMLLVTGMENVRDVIPFPRYNNHCKF